jgi:hypothetical protein
MSYFNVQLTLTINWLFFLVELAYYVTSTAGWASWHLIEVNAKTAVKPSSWRILKITNVIRYYIKEHKWTVSVVTMLSRFYI